MSCVWYLLALHNLCHMEVADSADDCRMYQKKKCKRSRTNNLWNSVVVSSSLSTLSRVAVQTHGRLITALVEW